MTTATITETDTLPKLAPEALYGLAGDIVRTIEPYSEADPVALLAHVLVAAGNVIGRGVHALVESTEHHCVEFVTLTRPTSKGRKGTAWGPAKRLLAAVDETWAKGRIRTGLSSGEGLIYNVRDPRWGTDKKGQQILEDEGESDKRLLVFEPELATVLRRMKAETNSLSSVMREAWDCGDLATLTKNSPLKATEAHISLISHITEAELVTSVTETAMVNGWLNRFLIFAVRRSKVLPESEPIPDEMMTLFIARLAGVVRWARVPRRLARDPDPKALWAAVYPDLSEGEPGLIGAVLGRAEAHVLRLSLIYAALECSPAIRPDHLTAALAVWDYSEASARRIFGHRTGLGVADTILAAVRRQGSMTGTDIINLFGRHKSAEEIYAALTVLEKGGKLRWRKHTTGGRPVKIWEEPEDEDGDDEAPSPYASWPFVWQCEQCGETHETKGKPQGPRPCLKGQGS